MVICNGTSPSQTKKGCPWLGSRTLAQITNTDCLYCVCQDGGKQLQEGIEANRTMQWMDLRLTECGQESEYCINQVLQRNTERLRRMKLAQLEDQTSDGVRRPKLGALIVQ